jgi:hypothetical protein
MKPAAPVTSTRFPRVGSSVGGAQAPPPPLPPPPARNAESAPSAPPDAATPTPSASASASTSSTRGGSDSSAPHAARSTEKTRAESVGGAGVRLSTKAAMTDRRERGKFSGNFSQLGEF